MKLRKCPCCPNMIAIDETTMCPICGCNPFVVRLKRYAAIIVAAVAGGWLLFTQIMR